MGEGPGPHQGARARAVQSGGAGGHAGGRVGGQIKCAGQSGKAGHADRVSESGSVGARARDTGQFRK